MKVKVSELSGRALDYAVIIAGAWSRGDGAPIPPEDALDLVQDDELALRYSTDWSQGGPIIERELMEVSYMLGYEAWGARAYLEEDYVIADTPLIAAMRCYVASKLGDEVEIPDELLES